MSDFFLLLLTADAVALLAVGTCAPAMPAVARLLAAGLSGLSLLVSLLVPVFRLDAASFSVPVGPPGLALRFGLDPLSMFFLVIVSVAATATMAFLATSVAQDRAAATRMTTFGLAGTLLSLLAEDGVSLAIGLAVICGAVGRDLPRMLIAVLILVAVCLLTPAGYAPRFDAIRAAPIDPNHATAAVALTVAAVIGLVWPLAGERSPIRDTLVAGLSVPLASYLLLRLIADLSAGATQGWWGLILVLAGAAGAVIHSWRSAALSDIDVASAALAQRQAGLATACVGLALIARAADLPGAATFALEATCLISVGAGVAGTLTQLSAYVIGDSAGTYRLSRLGGLVHTMPRTSAALTAGLLTNSVLPPSLGFAVLWLSFQSIASAPRTGGLLSQVPLALIAAAIALSGALATVALVRIVGIALLGRPRTPRGAGARENRSLTGTILLTLSGVSLATGVLPGPLLWLLADPAIHDLTGLPSNRGLALLSASGSSPGYLALPILALLGLAFGVVAMVPRRYRIEAKTVGPWTEGMQPPTGLPFGDPAAQSTGAGFLPPLPPLPPLRLRGLVRVPTLMPRRLSTVTTGLWLVLAAFAILLLVLAITQ